MAFLAKLVEGAPSRPETTKDRVRKTAYDAAPFPCETMLAHLRFPPQNSNTGPEIRLSNLARLAQSAP
jgi:hypothetical protein